MLLSVVIPVWNRADVIVRCINSVLAQELHDLELIVVDNGSTDATASTVAAIDDPRMRLLTLESNVGASAARNAGLAVASGTYVAFLDSDDAFGPRWSQVVTHAVAMDAAVVTCGFAMLDQYGQWRYDQACQDMGPALFHLVGPFQAGTFVANTALMLACGGYSTELRYSENTELALRLSKHCHDQSLMTSHVTSRYCSGFIILSISIWPKPGCARPNFSSRDITTNSPAIAPSCCPITRSSGYGMPAVAIWLGPVSSFGRR